MIRLLAVLVLLSGCQVAGRTGDRLSAKLGVLSGRPAADLVWTSAEGKHCMSVCAGTARMCLDDARDEGRSGWCRAEAGRCLAGCPDLRPPRCPSEGRVVEDMDCWRGGFCGRGECAVDHGCCVRR